MLAELNRVFGKNQNIEFFFTGTEISKYNNSQNTNLPNINAGHHIEFHNKNGASDAINFYIANRLLNGVGGLAYITPSTQIYNRIYLTIRQINDNKTTPHEFGHYFGLPHTFNQSAEVLSDGNPDFTKRERITRNTTETEGRFPANCSSAGDYFCDTHADPYGQPDAKEPQNCIINAGVDDNGNKYTPNMDNYMNYYWCGPYNFTPQQIEKMQAGYLMMNEKTKFFTAPDTPQTAPTNLQITSGTYANSTILSWKDNSEQETGYIIEVAEKGTDNFIPVGGVKANTESFKLDSNQFDRSKEYVFRVKPSNSKNSYSENSESFLLPTICAGTGTTSCTGTGAAFVINNFHLFN